MEVNYFKNLKLILKGVGISVIHNNNLFYKIYSLVIVFSCVCYVGITISEIFKNDFETIRKSLVYQCGAFIGVVKGVVMLQKRIEVGKIMESLERKPFLPNRKRGNGVEGNLIEECTFLTKMQEKVYWIIVVLSISFNVAIVAVKRIKNNHNWDFPFGPITIINGTYSPNYEMVCTYQVISISYITVYFVATDLTAAAVLAHISYQFKMLQNNVENIITLCHKEMLQEPHASRIEHTSNDNSIDPSIVPWKYLKEKLRDAIEYHLEIIKIGDEVENIFSGLFLVVFMNNLAITASTIYSFSVTPFNDNQIYFKFGEFLIASMQTLIVCYWGEQVVTQSQLVGNSAYSTEFYGTDLRFQRGLILIMRRSQNPVVITAAKFTAIGLSTFAWILQKSYTAYTLLQNRNS